MPLLILALAACGSDPAPESINAVVPAERPAPAPAASTAPPAQAQAPEPNGLESEEQGALAVARAYFDHLASGHYDAAWALRWKGEGDGADSRQAFRDNYALYAEHHATIGTPGRVEGAAGSLYVEIPVQLYGRMKTGEPFSSAGTITLRRVNDVPGSTAEQRRWRIYSRD